MTVRRTMLRTLMLVAWVGCSSGQAPSPSPTASPTRTTEAETVPADERPPAAEPNAPSEGRKAAEQPGTSCTDPARGYVNHDPKKCSVSQWTCKTGESPFEDSCGCGCLAAATP